MNGVEDIRREAQHDIDFARSEAIERLKNQMTFADAALKALLFANGGALVALFTFIGNAIGKGATAALFDGRQLWVAFACFVTGLTLALVCHLFAFLSQARFYNQALEELWRNQRVLRSGEVEPNSAGEIAAWRRGTHYFIAGIAFAIFSMTAFATGCGFALAGVLIG
jgi:hypothetical protein